MGSMLGLVKMCIYCYVKYMTLIERVGDMPLSQTGSTSYHAQLDMVCSILGFVVCYVVWLGSLKVMRLRISATGVGLVPWIKRAIDLKYVNNPMDTYICTWSTEIFLQGFMCLISLWINTECILSQSVKTFDFMLVMTNFNQSPIVDINHKKLLVTDFYFVLKYFVHALFSV